jgi:hypothetical protein
MEDRRKIMEISISITGTDRIPFSAQIASPETMFSAERSSYLTGNAKYFILSAPDCPAKTCFSPRSRRLRRRAGLSSGDYPDTKEPVPGNGNRQIDYGTICHDILLVFI